MKTFVVVSVLSLVTVGLSSGCGDNLPDHDPCTTLTLGPRDLHFNLLNQLTGVSYPVTGGWDRDGDRLLVELYDSTTGGLPALTTGTFPLGVTPDDDLATCQHCVWLPIDWDGVSPLDRILFATEGSVTLTAVEDPLSLVFAGRADDLLLREGTIDELGHVTLVDGGRCARVTQAAFDTTPTPGANCLSAEDCGNPALEVCQPATSTCVQPECGEFFGCPEDRPVCLSQYRESFSGACYAACDPTAAGGCADGEDCVQLGVDPAFGTCKRIGSSAVGASCEPEDTSTSCVAEALCNGDTGTCTRQCQMFADTPGCQAGASCTVLGVCEPDGSGDPAGFGQPCGAGAELAQGCAVGGGVFGGICFAFTPEDPLICEESCFAGAGCEPGEFCALRFSGGLGVCKPVPVCGDGERGEIDEVCDDGNTTSGDGCSADCRTVEYDVICGGLPLLALDASVSGDTASGWDAFQASCQFGLARAELYQVAPTGPGRLRVWIDSPTVQLVSLRSDCADPASELGCADNEDTGAAPELVVQITDETPAPLTAMVSALTVLEEGPFTVHVEFVAEQCGDGVIAGREQCDDGNTTGGDGCSADCRTVEYEVLCGNAQELAPGSTTASDTTGGLDLYTASCANTFLGSGPDRLYRVTATAAGRLRMRLEQGNADLALSAYTGCGAPAEITELACSSVLGVEEIEVSVTAGQEITVIVEGFSFDDTGPFSLTIEQLPP